MTAAKKKLTGLSHQTGENKTKQLTENTDYTAIYSNNVHPYTLTPGDEGFDSKKGSQGDAVRHGKLLRQGRALLHHQRKCCRRPPPSPRTPCRAAKVGEAYSQTLSATGTTPITWGIDSGNLPCWPDAGRSQDQRHAYRSGNRQLHR